MEQEGFPPTDYSILKGEKHSFTLWNEQMKKKRTEKKRKRLITSCAAILTF
uniref:Uncharacterized protein n=1 Tax=Arundo donax TaxID=35708 RepID=A0A0A9AHS4_ARUDO